MNDIISDALFQTSSALFNVTLPIVDFLSPIPSQGCLPHFTHFCLPITCLIVPPFTFRPILD